MHAGEKERERGREGKFIKLEWDYLLVADMGAFVIGYSCGWVWRTEDRSN